MDRLCYPYFSMTTGLRSQLCDSSALLHFVDEMHEMVEKSAPQKNFLFDTTTPHGDVIVTESSAMKPGLGWITLQTTEGIRGGIHEWCVKIENQGETTDGSGLMLGIVPNNYCKYDCFISQGGGWCLSRAGKFYGHWRRLDSRSGSSNNITFGTDERVILILDYDAARLSVRVGNNMIVGEISNLTVEVFPAISLHYRRQHVRFEYHVVHNRNTRQLSWVDRPILRPPTAFLPLTRAQLHTLELDSYVFSTLFVDRASQQHRGKKPEGNSSGGAPSQPQGLPPAPSSLSSPAFGQAPSISGALGGNTDASLAQSEETGLIGSPTLVPHEGNIVLSPTGEIMTKSTSYSLDAASARLMVLCNAFSAVQRFIEGSPPKPTYLSPNITAEYLRKRLNESRRGNAVAIHRDPMSGAQGGGTNATFNCGAVILSHLFARVAGDEASSIALPLASSLMDYLESLPLFSLSESQEPTFLSADIIQLATDNFVKLIERSSGGQEEGKGTPLSPLTATLIELTVLLALQRGRISETLRVCRFLFRFPDEQVSPRLRTWLLQHSYSLRPQGNIPDIYGAMTLTAENSRSVTRTGISSNTPVLSAAYYNDMIFVHTVDGFSKWARSGGAFVQLFSTKEPAACCNNSVTRSSIAVTSSRTLLMSDSLMREGICVVAYTITLEVLNTYLITDLTDWPIAAPSMPILSSGPCEQIILAYGGSNTGGAASGVAADGASLPSGGGGGGVRGGAVGMGSKEGSSPVCGAAAATASASPPLPGTVELRGFEGNSFPVSSWSTTLKPHPFDQFSLSHCLSLRKSGVVDLGSPEEVLSVVGGHVTIELYLMLLDREDATTIYQHGNRMSSGEVFIETARLEGAFCIRGGYRHDVHGSSVVFAPIPPTAETSFLHVALIFDGSWCLYFDGAPVSGSPGPQASVSAPRQKWTLGWNCTCLVAGLRVWRVSRAAREISRDYMRTLSGKEVGLVCNMFFNEPSGNVVFNYVSHPNAQHGVCSGNFTHLRVSTHPWKTYLTRDSIVPAQHSLHHWTDLTKASLFTTGNLVGLVHPLDENSPYAVRSGNVILFFDIKSGLAHLCASIIPESFHAKGKLGCDNAGHILELIDSKVNKSPQTASTAAAKDVLCLVNLTLEEERYGLPGGMPHYPVTHRPELPSQAASSATSRRKSENSAAASTSSPRAADEMDYSSSSLPPFTIPSGFNEPLNFSQLATWLLQLLSAYAEGEYSPNGELFSYMADDVGKRCVEEVKTFLTEHFRVVKGSNARRAVSFKSPVSTMAISSVLCILLRLIRRARAFALHPSTLGLNVMEADSNQITKETTSWFRRVTTSSYTPCASPLATGSSAHNSGNGEAPAESADALLALLGDIVNESSTTISPYLGNLAKAVLFEGIELFFPNLRCRVNLLREMLSVQGGSPPQAAPSAKKNTSKGPPTPVSPNYTEKTPAVELLMNAMVSSLGSIHSAIPLLSVASEDFDAGLTALSHSQDALSGALKDIQRTLGALVEESLFQLQKRSASADSSRNGGAGSRDGWGAPDILDLMRSADGVANGVPSHCRLLVALAESISSLQMLLLSSSQQGRGREPAITTNTTDLFSFPTARTPRPYIRDYYDTLFRASQQGLRLTLRCSSAESAMRRPPLDPTSLRVQLDLFQYSFMSTPLYAAITAIPLVITIEEAQWYLTQLEQLLPLCECLKKESQRVRENWNSCTATDAGNSPCETLYETVFFTSTWIAAFMAQHSVFVAQEAAVGSTLKKNGLIPTLGDAAPDGSDVAEAENSVPGSSKNSRNKGKVSSEETPPPSSNTAKTAVMKVCDHPLLSGGLRLDVGEDPALMNPQCRRRAFVVSLLKDRTRLSNLQRKVDPLGGKAPVEFTHVVPYMAVTAIYLSNIANIHRFPTARFDELLTTTMRRFFPVRASLIDRSAGKSKELRTSLSQEIVKRMNVLLCFTNVHCVDVSEGANNLNPHETTFFMDVDALQDLQDIRHHPDFPTGGKRRWAWAIRHVRSRLLRQRADHVTNADMDLKESVKLVSMIVTGTEEEEVTAEAIQQECNQRNRLVAIRLSGMRYLLRLLLREPSSAENISLLLTCNRPQLQVHFLYGLNGADKASLQHVTATLHQLMQWLKNYQLAASLGSVSTIDNLSSCASAYATVLSKMINRCWEPRDFDFLCQLSVVDVIFQQSCSIFTVSPDGSVLLSDMGVYERIHRDAAKEYAKNILMRAKEVTSTDEDQNEKSLVRTPAERSRCSGLACLKHLAIQSAAALTADLPITPACGCCTFLYQLFTAISKELRHCVVQLSQKEVQPAAVDIVSDQIHVLCGIVGVVVSALPPNAQITSVLHHAASQVARLLCLFVKFDAFCGNSSTHALRGAAFLRVSARLLSLMNPAIANTCFEDAEVRSVSTVYFGALTEENTVITFLLSLVIRSIMTSGLSCVSQHAILAVRDLLSSPKWAKLLSSMVDVFFADLCMFTNPQNSKDSHAHINAALKMYVWSAALGGCLLFLPGSGLPVRYTEEDSFMEHAAFVLDTSKDTMTVVPVDRAEASQEESPFNLFLQNPEEEMGDYPGVTDGFKTLSEDNLFMPTFSKQVKLPMYDDLLEDFVIPALERIMPMLEKTDHLPVDMISTIGFLSITLAMVQQPHYCEALVERGCIRLIHQVASQCTPRDALPVVYLKEFAAYAVSLMMKSLSNWSATGMLAVLDNASRGSELKLHAMPRATQGSRTVMMPTPPTLFGWTQARYTLMNMRDDQLSGSPPPGFPGIAPPRQPSPARTLLCFPVGKRKTPAYVAVTRTAEAGNVSLLNWGEGISLETAILMSDRLFPALGEDFTVPCQWGRPDLAFDIFSLYAFQDVGGGRGEDAPLLRVSVRGNELVCALLLSGDAIVEVTLGLQWEDWDTLMFIGAFLDVESITLCKGREITTKRLSPENVALLEQRRNSSDKITLLMVGTPPQPPTPDELSSSQSVSDVSETHHILLSGVRLSNSSKSKLSIQSIAEEVSREQTLYANEADATACYFPFSEGTGDMIQSSNGQYTGILNGNVRWVACSRKGTPLVSLECEEKLNTGSNSTKLFLPRKEVQTLFSSLDVLGLEYMNLGILESLSAHMTRFVVVAALEQCMSPDYELFLQTNHRPLTFHPQRFFEERGWAKQLANLLRYSDSGVLSTRQLELIHRFVERSITHLSNSEDDLINFFEDTASVVKSTLHFSNEVFPVDIPSLSQASKGCPLLPMTFLNGKHGVLSFDVKGRFVEHANVFRDRTQKTILAKFPDNKGSWPDFTIPSDCTWLYIRNFAFSRQHDGGSRLIALNVILRSMRPAVLNAFFTAACTSLKAKPPGYLKCLPYFLNSMLMTSMLPRENTTETEPDAIHTSTILCNILHLWSHFPDVQPFDRSPLTILLSNINASVVGFLHRGSPSQDEAQAICPALETYNAYTRQLVSVVLSGIQLEAAWYGRSFRTAVWERWYRLIRLWEQSASQVTWAAKDSESSSRSASGKAKTVKKRINVNERIAARRRLIDLEAVESMNSPPIVIHQRGSGEWFVRSERDVMTVRSSVGFTRGRIYFEVRMPDNNVNLNLAIGVVTEKWLKTGDGSSSLGQDAESWCFDIARLSSCFQGCRSDFTSRVKWKIGDVAGILLDLESNRLVCYHNDRQVSAFEKLKIIGSSGSSLPIFFPAVYFGTSGCNVNFGSAPFACRLPSGALPVDPSYFHNPEATKLWYMVSAMEWSNQLPDVLQGTPPPGHLAAAATGIHHYMGLHSASFRGGTAPPRPTLSRLLQSPVLSNLVKNVSEYSEGRSGALSVDLLCTSEKAKVVGNEVRVDEMPCLVRGSVTVYSGKWYYEVITRDEAGLSIGWASADHVGDWNRTRSLGDDEYSWALEGRRMIAKHNKHQINLNRHVWKSGNVVGCLLDCDAGTITYTINGNVQREVHDTSTGTEGVLFRNVNPGPGGITPAVSLEAKSEVTFMWNSEDLLYLPQGYKALGASCAVTQSLTEHFLLALEIPPGHTTAPDRDAIQKKEKEETTKAKGFSIDTMEKVMRFVSRSVDVSPMNITVYCLEKQLGLQSVAEKGSDNMNSKKGNRLASTLGLSDSELRAYLVALHVFSGAVERMYPFCYEGALPVDAGEAGCYFSTLYSSYAALKRYCLSFVHLRAVRRLLLASSGQGDNLKLTLHRREALMLARNTSASVQVKLRDSLFGQVFNLLAAKPSSLFCTNKKLWNVIFFGEGADDVGGPYRESLSQICTELMGPILPLFLPSPNQANEMGDSRETFVLAPNVRPPLELSMYQFLGRLMGGCLRSSEPLSLYLPSIVWRTLVGDTPDISDLERVDVPTVQSLQYMASLISAQRKAGASAEGEAEKKLDLELAEMIPDGFTITDDSGVKHELTRWGKLLNVNHMNAYWYILLTVYYKLFVLGSAPLKALKEGFHQVVPLYHVSCLKWYELEELVCGQRDYDPDELLDHARYDNIDPREPRVVYLREVLKEFSSHQRASFMRFVTGRERLPPGIKIRIMPDSSHHGNFAEEPTLTQQPPWHGNPMQSSSPIRRNQVSGTDSSVTFPFKDDHEPFDDERLPHASTCFYWLSLPKYSSKEVLKEKLLFAIEQCFDIDADFRVRDQDVSLADHQPALARVTVDDEEFEDYSHLR